MHKQVQVAVIAVLFVVGGGLVAVAICSVREAAQRTACRNNLRQLGLALEGYHDSNSAFPRGTVPSDTMPPEKRLSWLTAIHPYIEVGPVLLLDKKKAWDSDENRVVKGRLYPKDGSPERVIVFGEISLFRCPNNANRIDSRLPGVIHYVGSAGTGADAAELPKGDRRAGVFGFDRNTKLKEIKDGVATTLLMMETAMDNGPWTAGGPATVRGLDTARSPYLGAGRQFGGTHLGVANMLFVDGSVRLLADSVNPQVLEAMVTVAGGEEAGSPAR